MSKMNDRLLNFFTKLIVDPFPQYKPVLQKDGFLAASVTKNAFIKTLKRSNCLTLRDNVDFSAICLAISAPLNIIKI